MIVLGIDPGSHVTGYAFLQQDSAKSMIQVLEFGAIKAKATDGLMARLGTICDQLEPRIALYAPQMVSMEASFYSENARTALVLGHARGAIMALCHRSRLGFCEFSPRSIKQAVTGSGAASKDRVARMMQAHLRLADLPGSNDASDALAVAWTFLTQNTIAHNTPTTSKAPKLKLPSISTNTKGLVANALPPGVDIQSLLMGTRKRKKR
jgi:crossover junction endodeoxyribonuclease RuvC